MSLSNKLSKILIIDFGSQFTQLIARRIRELGVFSVIISHKKINSKKILEQNIVGIILSGGPLNVYQSDKFNFEENEQEKEKNINTVLLLNPKNEEAIYILMEIELKKSNFSKVRELADNFTKVCIKLCDNKILILESLKNLEPKNES